MCGEKVRVIKDKYIKGSNLHFLIGVFFETK